MLPDDKYPWPRSVAKPKGLIRYKRANYTQEIAVTNDRDRITPVHRSKLVSKWHQSGGMEGVAGYHSDVYKLIPVGGWIGVTNIDVWNGSNFQKNRGWTRSYPDGTTFYDILSKDGEVFEARERRKENGTWKSRVVFKDENHRPAGYAGLAVSCASCHDEAGSGGYATGLVPGGDTVLSDPFEALER